MYHPDLNRLTVSREAVEDGETVVSTARMSARSERSVTFRDEAERYAGVQSRQS